MPPPDVADVVRSAAWPDLAPAVTVVVSTVDRAGYLPGLLAALERQDAAAPHEVVVVDDGSTDRTWSVLRDLAAATPLPLTGLRLARNRGAGAGRNRGVAAGRAPLLAFTDDDCLPEPGWLGALVAAAEPPDVVAVQGRTEPEDAPPPGPWARSLWVTAPTPWLETCNVAYRRRAFDAVGGFAEDDPLFSRSGRGRGFGEDTWLGHRVLAAGGRRVFAADAVVRHRWRTGSYGQHLRERLLLRHFPELVRRVPEVGGQRVGRVFLTRRTAVVDLALAGAVTAAVLRRPVLLGAALPWVRDSLPVARSRRGPLALRLAQAALADVVGLAALLEGSVRDRTLVL